MPESKGKALVGPWAVSFRALLILAAPLALTACLPGLTSNTALNSPLPQPTPVASTLAEDPEARPTTTPLAPYGPVNETALASAEPATMESAVELNPVAVEPTAEAASIQAAPEQTALNSYQPALPPQTFTFTSSLIDQDNLLAEPFPGRLVTAQAGGRLLAAHGLLTPGQRNELGPLEAAPPALKGTKPNPALAAADPAPSAGEIPRSGRDKTGLLSANAKALPKGDRTRNLLTAAYEQTGRHYKSGGFSPLAGFDAAGYTHWVFARTGLNLPKTSAGLAKAGTAVTKENLRPGDVLIYRNQANQLDDWHVGIYSGQGNFLHASPKAGVVTETDAFGPQYAPYFQGGRRFFDDPGAAPLSENQKMAATSSAVKLALAELGPEDTISRPAPSKPAPKAAKPKAPKAAKK